MYFKWLSNTSTEEKLTTNNFKNTIGKLFDDEKGKRETCD
jgi:hypothetical protein